MTDFISPRDPARASLRNSATVTELSSRRRADDVLETITLVFGGVHYGTFAIAAPYPRGCTFALYVVPSNGDAAASEDGFRGPLDCLITDDIALSTSLEHVR